MRQLISFLCIFLALSVGVLSARNSLFEGTTSLIVGRDGLCLDVIGAFDDNHIPIQLWNCDSRNNKQWTIETDGTIKSLGKCMVPYNRTYSYVMINDCEKSSSTDKTWELQPDGTLTHVYTGLVLTATRAGVRSLPTLETNIYAATQRWSRKDYRDPTVITTIQGLFELCLTAQDDNIHVWMNRCEQNKTQQKWVILGDGTIRSNVSTNLCLTADGQTTSSVINLAKCEGLPQQRWEAQEDGTVLNPSSKLVMDVRGSDPSLRQIILFPQRGNANQIWIFSTKINNLYGSM